MKFEQLSQVAEYVSNRVDVEKLSLDNYISTENMIPDRGGVIRSSKLPAVKTVSSFSENDILISNIRPYFKKIWYANKNGGCSNDVLVIRAKEGIDPKFLYYVLSTDTFFNYTVASSKGTKMPRGDKHAIMQYKVPSFSIDRQLEIASILSALDDKIELNHKMNDTLEEMAQAIFKEWFVDFNFPGATDEFVDSTLGPIPIGWETQPIGEVFDFVIGGDWGDEIQQDDSQILCNVVRGTDLPGIGFGSIDKIPKRYISSRRLLTRELISNDIVFEISGGSTNQSTGRNFQFSKKILRLFSEPVVPTSFCRLIRINEEIMSHYIGALLTYFYDTGEAWDYQVQSTGISNFQFKDFCKRKLIVIPPKDILLKYSEIKKIIQNITGVLAKNNLTLINLRDDLLRNFFDTKTRQGA